MADDDFRERDDAREESTQIDDIERRLIRIETRLTKLMRHMGLRSDGTPVIYKQPTRE